MAATGSELIKLSQLKSNKFAWFEEITVTLKNGARHNSSTYPVRAFILHFSEDVGLLIMSGRINTTNCSQNALVMSFNSAWKPYGSISNASIHINEVSTGSNEITAIYMDPNGSGIHITGTGIQDLSGAQILVVRGL